MTDLSEVYTVSCVKFILLKSNPPQLLIKVNGEVRSSGWSDGELRLRDKRKPVDGIYHFDFVAKKPNGVVMPVISSIDADYFWGELKDLKGVCVYAENNKVCENIIAAQETSAPQAELTRGSYLAQNYGDQIIVWACGQHNQLYRTWLQALPITIYPPEFALYRSGGAATVLTKFAVNASFTTDGKVRSVRVHDADGAHDVPVVHMT